MQIVVLGATGFVGRTLAMMLQARGHEVVAVSRDPRRAERTLPVGTRAVNFADDSLLAQAVARADAIVNLAGEPIVDKRWTSRRKQQLVASRVVATGRLVDAIERRAAALPVLVSASATGWYGDRGDELLDERSGPGDGFAAELCREWETAALAARASRVVIARFGVILGRDGGALAALRPLYRFGLGGPIGDGSAWLPWIHVDDAARAIVHAIDHRSIAGTVAVVAPEPVRQRDFAHAYARMLHRPAIMRTPRAMVRAALGERAQIITSSQRVIPRALLGDGFVFRFPALATALRDLTDDGVAIARAGELPDSEYLRARGARYVLRSVTELAAPRNEVFAFFSAPENLAALTPPSLAFEIVGPPRPNNIALGRGSTIDYNIRISGVPLRWRTQIEAWQPGELFVDSQHKGPYRSWWHEHRFYDRGDTTVMEDLVYFSPPLGALGKLVVEDRLRRIFGYRRGAIRARFDAHVRLPSPRVFPTPHEVACDHGAHGSLRWRR